MMKQRRQSVAGFTLVELLVALMIASVVLSAVAALASATGSAAEITDQAGREQAQLRHVNVRVGDLIRRANQVVETQVWGFRVWHDENQDGIVDFSETTWIWSDAGETIRIGDVSTTEIYQNCQNVTYAYDELAPNTRFVIIQFEMTENGLTQAHSINAHLRGSDGS